MKSVVAAALIGFLPTALIAQGTSTTVNINFPVRVEGGELDRGLWVRCEVTQQLTTGGSNLRGTPVAEYPNFVTSSSTQLSVELLHDDWDLSGDANPIKLFCFLGYTSAGGIAGDIRLKVASGAPDDLTANRPAFAGSCPRVTITIDPNKMEVIGNELHCADS